MTKAPFGALMLLYVLNRQPHGSVDCGVRDHVRWAAPFADGVDRKVVTLGGQMVCNELGALGDVAPGLGHIDIPSKASVMLNCHAKRGDRCLVHGSLLTSNC